MSNLITLLDKFEQYYQSHVERLAAYNATMNQFDSLASEVNGLFGADLLHGRNDGKNDTLRWAKFAEAHPQLMQQYETLRLTMNKQKRLVRLAALRYEHCKFMVTLYQTGLVDSDE